MSRAFTREDDASPADFGERPVSRHRNLVTPDGLAAIESELARLREELGAAERASDREGIARVSRDLRYWTTRRETAEVSVPEPGSGQIRFGMTVELEGDGGRKQRWTIVGEDEADAANGKISHVSPMAQALFGKTIGDEVSVGGRDWEIVGVGSGTRE